MVTAIAVVLISLASVATAEPPPQDATASRAHAKSIPELKSIADPRNQCLAAIDAAQQLISGEGAAEWGDFLIGARDLPPDAKPNQEAALALAIAENARDRLPEKDRKSLSARISILRRFNTVFLAIAEASSATSQPDGASLLDAASDLAEYLDDANPALAESARLWQAVAYWRAGKTDRAIKFLKPIVSAPADARIGLVSRLSRCRLLADTGLHAAALAHCTRMADRMPRWFDSESEETRKAAANTIRFVQINILESWLRKLRAAGDEDGAAAVANQLAEFKTKSPTEPGDQRLRLMTPIGGLKPLDPGPGPASDTASTTTRPERDSN